MRACACPTTFPAGIVLSPHWHHTPPPHTTASKGRGGDSEERGVAAGLEKRRLGEGSPQREGSGAAAEAACAPAATARGDITVMGATRSPPLPPTAATSRRELAEILAGSVRADSPRRVSTVGAGGGARARNDASAVSWSSTCPTPMGLDARRSERRTRACDTMIAHRTAKTARMTPTTMPATAPALRPLPASGVGAEGEEGEGVTDTPAGGTGTNTTLCTPRPSAAKVSDGEADAGAVTRFEALDKSEAVVAGKPDGPAATAEVRLEKATAVRFAPGDAAATQSTVHATTSPGLGVAPAASDADEPTVHGPTVLTLRATTDAHTPAAVTGVLAT